MRDKTAAAQFLTFYGAWRGIAGFITSLLAGPEAGVGAALLEGIKDGLKSGVEGQLKGLFPSGEVTADSPPQIEEIIQADSNWERIVRQWYDNGGRVSLDANVTYDHIHYGGQPSTYIDEFGGPGKANFLSSHGKTILPLAQIQANPRALAAYNAWLRDAAVADANANAGGNPPQQLQNVFQQQTSDFNQ